jgi:tetratricopeptide (TPR) repeat protein
LHNAVFAQAKRCNFVWNNLLFKMERLNYLVFIFIFQLVNSFSYGQVNVRIDSLEYALGKAQFDMKRVNLYQELASAHINHNSHKALGYAEKAYELSLKLENNDEVLSSVIILSEVNANISDYKLAIDYAKMAQDYARETGDIEKIGQIKTLFANNYLALFDLEKSMEFFYESLNLFEKVESKVGICTALNGLGIIYHEQGNFDKALEFFLKCYEINKEIGDKAVVAASINNLASSYNGKQQYEKSIHYYKEAVEINKEYGNKNWECVGYLNLGESYLNLGDQREANKYFKKAIKLAIALGNSESIVNSKISLANYYFEINELDSCIAFANEAHGLAEKYHLKHLLVNTANILQKAYRRFENFEKAYKYAIIQSQLKDSLKIEQSIQKIANLELKYRIEKEEQEQELAFQKKQSQQIIMGLSLFSIFIIVVVILIARQRITVKNMILEKNRVDGKLEMRNKELAINVMTLLKKNDMLTSISKELYEVKSTAVKGETKDAINRISRKIKKSSESEIWKEFELRFKEVHSEFYRALAKRFPNLTPGDQRLCALLRLNLSSKEIAELTGQSLNALEKARYRLRKKLNLTDPSVNLINYLSGL